MAIGSVNELIDYKTETIKIAQKYGGGGGTVDLSMIADVYDETHQYPYNDMVIHNNKLYKATTAVNTPGVFNPDMWNEILAYNGENTYNTGDYATKTVEGDNRCFRCDEDSVTGEWDATKWTDVSELDFEIYNSNNTSPYYKNSSKVYQIFYPDMKFYYIANANYEPTGGAGEWNSSKWTETTVEAVINVSKVKYIQLCSTADIATDANGFLTNALTLPENLQTKTIVSVEPQGNMAALMKTYLVQYFPALVSGQHTLKIRLLGTDGSPLASKSAGTFTDAGVLILSYI